MKQQIWVYHPCLGTEVCINAENKTQSGQEMIHEHVQTPCRLSSTLQKGESKPKNKINTLNLMRKCLKTTQMIQVNLT